MFELGMKNEILGADLLRKLKQHVDYRSNDGRPASLPQLKENEKVIVGYDQGLGERMIVCNTLEEVQELYDNYARGSALRIHYYVEPDPGFVIPGAPCATEKK